MNVLYTVLQFVPYFLMILLIVLCVAIIYILLGPLPKLIKATLAYLESKKPVAKDIVIIDENAIEKTPELE